MDVELARRKIILALDVPQEGDALRLAELLRDDIGMVKVGLELFSAAGPQIVARLVAEGVPVMIDLKLMDIPNTVAGAVRQLTAMRATLLTVHSLGGHAMISAAVVAANETATQQGMRPPGIVAVTVLTSISQANLNEEIGIPGSVQEVVAHLARMANHAGAAGVVASAAEAVHLRGVLPRERFIITPGIRPTWAAADDQKRVVTPRDAISAGATHVVIGRAITRPPVSIGGPKEAARLVVEEIATAMMNGRVAC